MSVDHVGKPTVVPCSWPNGKKDNAITGLMEAFAAQVKKRRGAASLPGQAIHTADCLCQVGEAGHVDPLLLEPQAAHNFDRRLPAGTYSHVNESGYWVPFLTGVGRALPPLLTNSRSSVCC